MSFKSGQAGKEKVCEGSNVCAYGPSIVGVGEKRPRAIERGVSDVESRSSKGEREGRIEGRARIGGTQNAGKSMSGAYALT